MCEKPCRDANGFKCHQTSESHLRNMQLFASNSKKILDEFSDEFHKSFLEVLRRRGHTRILANRLYQEVIQERHHTHLNSTKWGSLTSYCQFLAEQQLAEVETTERGIYVTYIDKTPDSLKRAEQRRTIEQVNVKCVYS